MAVRVPASGRERPGHRRLRVPAQGYRVGTRIFTTALAAHRSPAEVFTDRAPALANVIEELIPAAFHNTGQYENNRCECDHGRLKAQRRPMRDLKTDRMASMVIREHAFVQSLRRGRCELGVEVASVDRPATAFDALRLEI